jgi:uncharacterized membrane protein
MNPLKNPWYTALAGLVLAVVISLVMGDGSVNPAEIAVWFHVVVGVMWIGLLYYFNFVQVPAVNAALADGDPGPAAINKYVAPKALWFFRWAALLTWLSGAITLYKMGIMHEAMTFGGSANVNALGMGAWLGTIMLFNVWGLIWPNQKKLLGIKPASDEEKAKAKVVALYASRTNTLLSIPMLLGMTAYGHGLPF